MFPKTMVAGIKICLIASIVDQKNKILSMFHFCAFVVFLTPQRRGICTIVLASPWDMNRLGIDKTITEVCSTRFTQPC